MFGIIGGPEGQNKPAPLLTFTSYIDTLAVVVTGTDRLPRSIFRQIIQIYGDRPHGRGHRFEINDRTIAYLVLTFQCPQPDLIEALVDMAQQLVETDSNIRVRISRLDIGYDVMPDPLQPASEQFRFIKEHVLMRYRRRQPIKVIDNDDGTQGYYFSHYHGQRDLVLYLRRSKLPEYRDQPVARMELRVKGCAARKVLLSDLFELDPMKHLFRHIRFVSDDLQKRRLQMLKRVVQTNTGVMRAKARLNQLDDDAQLEFMQRVYDQSNPSLFHPKTDLVSVPNALMWGAVRNQNARCNEINDIGVKCIKGRYINMRPPSKSDYHAQRLEPIARERLIKRERLGTTTIVRERLRPS
ncbi:hypothetical protein [Nitrobacter vulgaris]|uniref:Uncharacterized protein n=1 Tax=Nitrobacter vulgaris TaxID=29421 RepID=A0A1V4HWX6_NITVU|nr:hypothetical protein [Nitrobacter vulgaris]OPH82379.1 hypothetical protein B2M20_12380 [Nitrobacter vulgaris]